MFPIHSNLVRCTPPPCRESRSSLLWRKLFQDFDRLWCSQAWWKTWVNKNCLLIMFPPFSVNHLWFISFQTVLINRYSWLLTRAYDWVFSVSNRETFPAWSPYNTILSCYLRPDTLYSSSYLPRVWLRDPNIWLTRFMMDINFLFLKCVEGQHSEKDSSWNSDGAHRFYASSCPQ